MPELPEVETTKNGIKPYILNQTINQVMIHREKLRYPIASHLKQTLKKTTFTQITRRGKYLCLKCEQGTLIIHLGMSGNLSVASKKTAIGKHCHFEIIFANQQSLRLTDPRRFGAVLWQENGQTHPRLANLGVEPLSNRFNKNFLWQKSQLTKRPIKTLIMDSGFVVGIGNIYACESLFLSAIHPEKKANTLTLAQCTQLVNHIKKTLKNAIKQGGTTLKDFVRPDGQAGYFYQKLNVYQQNGQPCPNCATPIIKIIQNNRASFLCQKCQKI